MSREFFKAKKGLNIQPTTVGAVNNPEVGDLIVDSADSNKLKRWDAAANAFVEVSGSASEPLNLLEDGSFERISNEGTVTGGTLSLNTTTRLPAPNNKSSLELNFNNVTGNYTLEKNTGAEYDSVQGVISVWIKTAKAGVILIPRVNGVDQTANQVAVQADNKWKEYVIPTVIGTTSFGFRVSVTASNAGSIFIDEAYVGAAPATMTPEVAQAEFFGGVTANGTANCTWSTTSGTYANFAQDLDCPVFTPIGKIQAPATRIPGFVIPAGSPSGTYRIRFNGFLGRGNHNVSCFYRMSDGVSNSSQGYDIFDTTISTQGSRSSLEWAYNYTTSNSNTTIQIQALAQTAGNSCDILNLGGYTTTFDVYYYPPKTKIYSNDSSGWFVDVNIGGGNPSLGLANVATYTEITNANLDMVINPGSQPAQIPCSGTNPSTGLTCAAGNESIGVVFNVPTPGQYEVCFSGSHGSETAAGAVVGAFQLIETPNNAQTNLQQGNARVLFGNQNVTTGITPVYVCGIFNFTSTGQKTVRLMYEQTIGGTVGLNALLLDRAATQGQRDARISVRPFINLEQINGTFKQIDDELQAVGFQARKTSVQTIPGGSETIITFGTEDYDTHNLFNPATGVFTADRPGLYLASCRLRVSPNVAPSVGSEFSTSIVGPTGARNVFFYDTTQQVLKTSQVSYVIRLNTGQQLTCRSFVSISHDVFGSGGENRDTMFSVVRIAK